MHVAIIIVNWNGKKDTLACISSLQTIVTKHQITIVIVDNASTDESIASFRKLTPRPIIIENKENFGFAQGNNSGIEYAIKKKVDYILLLNNDTIVDKKIIDQLVFTSERFQNRAIIGGKIYFYPGKEFHSERYSEKEKGKVFWFAGGVLDWNNVLPYHCGVDEVDNGQYDSEYEFDFISGCCFFAPTSIFVATNGFDPLYFAYYEDVDLSVRAKKLGYHLIYSPKAVLWHKNAGSSGGSGSNVQQYYMIRNQLLFGMRFVSLRAKLALLKQSLIILLKGNKWEKWGVIDYFSGNLGKAKRNF